METVITTNKLDKLVGEEVTIFFNDSGNVHGVIKETSENWVLINVISSINDNLLVNLNNVTYIKWETEVK